ncbi:MAG TPA: Mur ligase family protein, partial [Chloroflexota bacterium]
MTLRLSSALAAGRIAANATRRLHLGGATVLPGHVAGWVDPSALGTLALQLGHGIVLITGTNGKTTTARMVASVATAAGMVPVHNRSGANLPSGVLSALVSQATLGGELRGDVGVFEVD